MDSNDGSQLIYFEFILYLSSTSLLSYELNSSKLAAVESHDLLYLLGLLVHLQGPRLLFKIISICWLNFHLGQNFLDSFRQISHLHNSKIFNFLLIIYLFLDLRQLLMNLQNQN